MNSDNFLDKSCKAQARKAKLKKKKKFIKNSEAPVQQRKLSIQWSGIQQNGKKKYL